MKSNWWFKFEWDKWLNDRELHRCSFETRGFWIECICLMEESGTWSIEGTFAEIANLLGCSISVAKRCINDLEQNNAAQIAIQKVQKNAKSQDFVKIVSRRLLKRYNLKEYNRLAKQKERLKKNVKPKSNVHSKDKSLKALEEEIREEREGETPSPLPPPANPLDPTAFEHPAVVIYQEKFCVHAGNNFAKQVARHVTDLGVWTQLIDDRIAYADEPLETRKRIARWILKAYDERIEEKKNGKNKSNNRNGKRTAADVLEQAGDFYANYPGTGSDLVQ